MGNNRPIKKKDWIRFLTAHGCRKARHKGTSHQHWKCPNCTRTITFQAKFKEVPGFVLRSNAKSLGISVDQIYEWVDKN